MSLCAPRQILPTLAVLAAGALAAPASSTAGPLGSAPTVAGTSAVIQVDGDWDDDRYHRYYHRRYKGRTYVDAPYARVETRGRRWTSVDAPFTSVRVRPWGVWVRAPFVDLYIPR